MAGPSVVVRILGDLKGLSNAVGNAGKAAESSAARMHTAFRSALGALNESGVLGPFGEVLSKVDEGLSGIEEHGKRLGAMMMGVGAVATGVGGLLSTLGSKEQASHQQLVAAVDATGKSYDDYGEAVERAIKHNEKFGQSSMATQDALRILTQATGNPAKALQLLGTATDLAAAKHEDLASAASALGKVYNGNTKLLKEFGIEAGTKASVATKALASATKAATSADEAAAAARQRLSDLQARYGTGTAAAAVSTAGLTAAQNRLADAQRRLAELQQEDTARGKPLTIAQTNRLRDAQIAVTRATTGLHTAQSGYAAAQDKAAKSAGLSVAQQQALRNAQARVTTTADAARAAHAKLAAAHGAVTKAAGTQDATMTALANKLHGQAAASVDTFTGKLKVIGVQFEDQAAQIGQKYGPAITAAGAGMTVLGGVIDTAGGFIKKFSQAQKTAQTATEALGDAQKVATTATEAQTGAEVAAEAAGAPMILVILAIVAAVAALAAIAYVIYRNWNTIWAGMKAAVAAVWNWIRTNWPLLLAILLGPIGIAVDLIVKNWAKIKQGAADVLAWIRTNWPLIIALITGPVGVAVLVIVRNWGSITNAANAVLHWFATAWQSIYTHIVSPVASAIGWVEGAFNGLVGWIAGLPGRVAGVWSSMWSGFAGILRRIVDGWNALHFTLPSIDTHIPGIGKIGGTTVGVPPIHIPGLATGGMVMSDGLAYLHAAEVVTPAPQAARTGPAVVVQQANFATDIDIDTFMRRAAWVVATRGV